MQIYLDLLYGVPQIGNSPVLLYLVKVLSHLRLQSINWLHLLSLEDGTDSRCLSMELKTELVLRSRIKGLQRVLTLLAEGVTTKDAPAAHSLEALDDRVNRKGLQLVEIVMLKMTAGNAS
jgi:hypothetical protein